MGRIDCGRNFLTEDGGPCAPWKLQEALRLNPDHARAGAAFKRLRNIQRAIDGGKEAADKREFDEAIELYTKVHRSPPQRPLSHSVTKLNRYHC
jgi:hypothetical protein